MSELRDYVAWHDAYDDPDSRLSWRLEQVRRQLRHALDARPGPVRILSSCAGDGRDVLGVLGERDDCGRVTTTLLETDDRLAEQARTAASALSGVEVRTVDAGRSDAYAGAVPADVVLLVGIFGNITDADVRRTVRAAAQFCAPGATLLWSRGRAITPPTAGISADLSDDIRSWWVDAGFVELDYVTRDGEHRPSLGTLRYDGAPQALVSGQHLFTFLR